MKAYSPEIKEMVLQKLLPPQNKTLKELARETNLSIGTIHKWKTDALAKGVIDIGPTSKNTLDSRANSW